MGENRREKGGENERGNGRKRESIMSRHGEMGDRSEENRTPSRNGEAGGEAEQEIAQVLQVAVFNASYHHIAAVVFVPGLQDRWKAVVCHDDDHRQLVLLFSWKV